MIWLKNSNNHLKKTKRYALEICSFASIWMHGKKKFNLNKTTKSKYLKEDTINMSFR